MENRNNLLVIILLALVIIISWGLTRNFNENTAPTPTSQLPHICKEDSLQHVIDSLQINITSLEDGFDFKEQRYEDILFEYEYGIDRLKETHPSAYKEFHRIISYRERYSKKDERDNLKRLKYKDEYDR